MTKRWTIAFDADDTLWHNERFFQATGKEFEQLLADYCDPENLSLRLRATEARNLRTYGYGIKGYTLSLIETAIEITKHQVPVAVIDRLLALGRDLHDHPMEILPGAAEALSALAGHHDLLIITKGDLLHQERKVAQSGLGDYFGAVDIVSEKTAETYQHIFARYDNPRVMMVGNSLKSDILPALETGAWGVWLSENLTWSLETAAEPVGHPKFHKILGLSDLPALLSSLS